MLSKAQRVSLADNLDPHLIEMPRGRVAAKFTARTTTPRVSEGSRLVHQVQIRSTSKGRLGYSNQIHETREHQDNAAADASVSASQGLGDFGMQDYMGSFDDGSDPYQGLQEQEDEEEEETISDEQKQVIEVSLAHDIPRSISCSFSKPLSLNGLRFALSSLTNC